MTRNPSLNPHAATPQHLIHFASAPLDIVLGHVRGDHGWSILPGHEDDRLYLVAAHMVAHDGDRDDFPTHPQTGHTCLQGPVCGGWYERRDEPGCGHESCRAAIHTPCQACMVMSLTSDTQSCPFHGAVTYPVAGDHWTVTLACGCQVDQATGNVEAATR